jgi:hypothetical protein
MLPMRQCLYALFLRLLADINGRAQRNSFQAGFSTLIQTLDTIWYDQQLVKWSASRYGQFTPYKTDSLSI